MHRAAGQPRNASSSSLASSSSSTSVSSAIPAPKKEDNSPVTWSSLPRKDQLAILTITRLTEPITQFSLQAYIFYQVRSFNPDADAAVLSRQTGFLQAAFTAAQFLTAFAWGRAADADSMGRKRVLLLGLLGNAISCLGLGFSRSLAWAMLFRIMAGGLNGNVGVMRTMISEVIYEKKFQSRAFLLLPMCFNIGVIIGPMIGGALADPIQAYPALFGPGSALGGDDGVWWMKQWPYALPNFFSTFFALSAWTLVFLGLDETHPARKHLPDRGRQLGKFLVDVVRSRGRPFSYRHAYAPLHPDEYSTTDTDLELNDRHSNPQSSSPSSPPSLPPSPPPPPSQSQSPSKKSIWTKNVLLTLLNHFLLALHIGTFNSITYIFLPAPRVTPPRHPQDPPFHFTGGLSLTPSRVGLTSAIIGAIGLPLQILLYPRVHASLGTMRAFRTFLPFSCLAYTLMPFLVFIPPSAPSWLTLWPAITVVCACQVVSRTFALPALTLLVNNSIDEPRMLGTLHGVAQSVASGARTIGPALGGWGLGLGLENNFVGGVWWGMAAVVAVGWGVSWAVFEGVKKR